MYSEYHCIILFLDNKLHLILLFYKFDEMLRFSIIIST